MYSVAETEAILCLGLYSVVLVGRGLQAKVKGPTRNLTLNGLAVPRLEAPCRSTLHVRARRSAVLPCNDIRETDADRKPQLVNS